MTDLPFPWSVRVKPGDFVDFDLNSYVLFREPKPEASPTLKFYSSYNCDENGANCQFSRLRSLKSTIFEFKFNEDGTRLFRVNHSDGWTVPYKVTAAFDDENLTTAINCETLTMDACPHIEPIIGPSEDEESAVDDEIDEGDSLYRRNPYNQLYSGCASPCSRLDDSDVSQSCCNHNLASTVACSAEPASTQMYYQAIRERCTITASPGGDPPSVDDLLLDNDSDDSRWLPWQDDSIPFEISLYEPYTNCNTVGLGNKHPNGLEETQTEQSSEPKE